MRLEGQGAQEPGRQGQPGGQEGGHPQVGHHPQGIPNGQPVLGHPGGQTLHLHARSTSLPEPAGKSRVGRAHRKNCHSLKQAFHRYSQKDPKPAHHIHKTPAITKSPSINTPQVRQPAQTAITSRQATIRPNSRDGLLALKCGKSGVIVEMTPNSVHDARIRQNSVARTCAKSKICAGTNARNKRDQRSLCGPLPVDAASRTCSQKQEEDSAILLTTVHEQLPLQRGQGRPKPVRRQVKDDPPARKTNSERRAETLSPSPLTRTVIA